MLGSIISTIGTTTSKPAAVATQTAFDVEDNTSRDTVGRGPIAPDVAKGIARGTKKHGYDSIRFKSDKGPGINTVIFDPNNVRPIGVAE